MKQVFTLTAVAAVAAGLCLAQMPGHDCHEGGPRTEKREIRMIKGGDGPGMGMGMRGEWWENPEVVKGLGLSDKQAKDIDALAMQHRKEMIKAGADLKIKRMELHGMIGDNAKDAEIKAKAREVSQLKQRLHDARIDHLLSVRKVLTAEQQAKLKEMKGSMRGHRGRAGCHGGGDCR